VPAKICDATNLGAVIAKLPVSAIESIHELPLAGDNSDRKSSTHYLAVRFLCLHESEVGLRTTWANSETGYHSSNINAVPDFSVILPNFVQEISRLAIQVSGFELARQARPPIHPHEHEECPETRAFRSRSP